MSKKLLVVIIILVLAAIGITYAALNKDDRPLQNSPPSNTDVNPPEANQNAPTGRYVVYTDTIIAETEGEKVLFFHAPWCPQCRALEADILKDGVPEGVTIIKVDYDSNQALRQKYGVTIQTTLVKVDDAGNKLDLYVAYEEPTLDSVKANLL